MQKVDICEIMKTSWRLQLAAAQKINVPLRISRGNCMWLNHDVKYGSDLKLNPEEYYGEQNEN